MSKTKISNGNFPSSYCVTADGNLYVSGHNGNGQFGFGDTTTRNTWTKVTTSGIVENVADIFVNQDGSADESGTAAFLITKDGNLWAAGFNGFGGLGLGDKIQRTNWTKVSNPEIAGFAKAVAYTFGGDQQWSSSYLVTTTGDLWVTGYNSYGELGFGDTTQRTSWTKVTISGLAGNADQVFAIRNGDEYSYACSAYCITKNGDLWVTGNNYYGQLGLGDDTNQKTWAKVTKEGVAGLAKSISLIRNGDYNAITAYLITTDGNLFVTGYNEEGELGLGDYVYRLAWTKVTTAGIIGNAVAVSSGGGSEGYGRGSGYCITKDGKLWVTGYNYVGQLGLGNSATRNSWTKTSLEGVVSVWSRRFGGDERGCTAAYAVKENGELWVTGNNEHGELGLGSTANKNSWTKADVPGSVVSVYSAGYKGFTSACCLTEDGNLYVTGYNAHGQLGLGDTTQRTTWTKVTTPGIIDNVDIGFLKPTPSPSQLIPQTPASTQRQTVCRLPKVRGFLVTTLLVLFSGEFNAASFVRIDIGRHLHE